MCTVIPPRNNALYRSGYVAPRIVDLFNKYNAAKNDLDTAIKNRDSLVETVNIISRLHDGVTTQRINLEGRLIRLEGNIKEMNDLQQKLDAFLKNPKQGPRRDPQEAVLRNRLVEVEREINLDLIPLLS